MNNFSILNLTNKLFIDKTIESLGNLGSLRYKQKYYQSPDLTATRDGQCDTLELDAMRNESKDLNLKIISICVGGFKILNS